MPRHTTGSGEPCARTQTCRNQGANPSNATQKSRSATTQAVKADVQSEDSHKKSHAEKASPPVEYTKDITPLRKLDTEPAPAHPIPRARTLGRSDVSVSTGSSASYDAIIAGYIKSKWIRPSRAVVGDNPRPVSVAIRIAMDGKIRRSRVVKSSEIDVLDASALQAIQKSNPLPVGLPSYMARRYYNVTIVFCITDEA